MDRYVHVTKQHLFFVRKMRCSIIPFGQQLCKWLREMLRERYLKKKNIKKLPFLTVDVDSDQRSIVTIQTVRKQRNTTLAGLFMYWCGGELMRVFFFPSRSLRIVESMFSFFFLFLKPTPSSNPTHLK